MAKREEKGESRPAACQRLPKGHFDHEGLSQGDRIGEGRKTHDAYNDMGKPAEGPKEK